MTIAERSMGLGLRALGAIAGSDVVDRLGMREPAERFLYRATRDGFRAASAAGRSFKVVRGGGSATRLRPAGAGLFDLTPTDEQQFLTETLLDFADTRLRAAASRADAACAAPPELLAQAAELGIAMLGVPEELGGAVSESSTVTAALSAEALAHGDLGLAGAILAPTAVGTALSLWGDADQQQTYLPTLVADEPPVAALCLQEPRALFDPFALRTTARRDGGDFVIAGEKSLVIHGEAAELLIVAAALEDGSGPALFLVETSETDAGLLLRRAAPAMGLRPAATADLRFEDVRVPARALVGEGDPAVYAECVRRARLAWSALAVGTARAVLDYVTPYVNERVAFGEPISHRQAVAFGVSNIAIELEGMRLVTLRAASRADMGKDFSREVALARSLCASKGTWIGSEGVQLLGGHGYVKEHPVERWYRDLQAAALAEGGVLV